ncbi:MAG: acyl-CoA dehydrogenase family protein [Rhodothermales bacterium]|nr:acyl-CoA dehydrogenase family protein [Rhodothermales bacterium]
MDFTFTEEQVALRDAVVRFAQRELNEGAADRDRDQAFPRDLWLACGQMGLQGLPVPEDLGGSGLDPLTTALALEGLGYGCTDGGLVFAVCAHLLACVVPLWKHGSDAQRQRYLPGLCDGTLIAVNGMTEAGAGSDAFAMTTTAERTDDGYVLNGTKLFSSNGPVADLAVVYAITDPGRGFHGGVTAFLVETDAPGFRSGQRFEKMGLRSCPLGELVLEDVRVPACAALGGEGAGAIVFAESMNWERTCLVAAHVGTMERLVEEAVDYARTRHSGGQPIGKHQAVAHRLADAKVRLEAARLLVYRAASRLETARAVALDASVAKLFASEALVQTAADAMRVFGGYGFVADYGVERALRDAMAAPIYSGTSEVQRNTIARWLGL